VFNHITEHGNNILYQSLIVLRLYCKATHMGYS
jgi:hypothetical protein